MMWHDIALTESERWADRVREAEVERLARSVENERGGSLLAWLSTIIGLSLLVAIG